MKNILMAALCLAFISPIANAADFSDPTWPCVQRKVDRLSPGLMWPWPLEEVSLPADAAQQADQIVARLALRRVELSEVEPLLNDFTATHGASRATLGHLFQQAFDRLARDRRTIITGIEDYSLKQIALSGRIEETRVRMDQLMAADAPDFDQVDALEEQLDWDERIYTDRQRSLTYVCESPVLLEKRLFAIAQLLQGMADD